MSWNDPYCICRHKRSVHEITPGLNYVAECLIGIESGDRCSCRNFQASGNVQPCSRCRTNYIPSDKTICRDCVEREKIAERERVAAAKRRAEWEAEAAKRAERERSERLARNLEIERRETERLRRVAAAERERTPIRAIFPDGSERAVDETPVDELLDTCICGHERTLHGGGGCIGQCACTEYIELTEENMRDLLKALFDKATMEKEAQKLKARPGIGVPPGLGRRKIQT